MLNFLLFYIASMQLHQGGETKTTNLCTLPPYPKHGRYKVLQPEVANFAPGDKLYNYTIEYECDPGYHRTEETFNCYGNGTTNANLELESEPEIAECLPECNPSGRNKVSCGKLRHEEDARCVFPDKVLFLVPSLWGSRILEEEKVKDCGVRYNDSVPITKSSYTPLDTRDVHINRVSLGISAKKFELPWHAGIYTKKKIPYMQICGGTLVSKSVVISAAHCFWKEKLLPASEFAVAVGKLYRPWNEKEDDYAQKSDVAEIKLDPHFQGEETSLQDDIALVFVTFRFKYTIAVRPICLDFDAEDDKKALTGSNDQTKVYGTVGGWGLTSDSGPASPVLKVANLPIVPIEECILKSDKLFKLYITSDKICAGNKNALERGVASPSNDLLLKSLALMPLLKHRYTQYFLRGVVSGAPQNDFDCNTHTWATFTHVLRHEHFIRSNIPEE